MLDDRSRAIVLPGGGVAPTRLPELAQRLEAAGYGSVWTGEVNFLDAVTPVAITGAATEHIGLGTFLSIYTRAPTVMALTAATLARAFPGRCEMVLGASSPLLVEAWNGVPHERPLSRMRDVLRFLRVALTGERVDDDFDTFSSRGFRLADAPEKAPVVLVAAAGPQMSRLADVEADGVVVNWCSAPDMERLAGLPRDRARIAAFVTVCPTADATVARKVARPLIASYLSAPGYAALQRRLGRGPQLESTWREWDRGRRREAIDAVPDAVVDELVVYGSPDECRSRLVAFEHDAGVRPIVSYVLGDASFERVATRVAPRDTSIDWIG